MKIHNVRLGLATNSSSTHSIVFLSKPVQDDGVEDGSFGWDRFTAASLGSKRAYLGATLYENLRSELGPDIAEAVVQAWLPGITPRDATDMWSKYGDVDHQSRMDLPRAWNSKGVDKAFFEDLKRFFFQENVAVLGGNDNDSQVHPLVTESIPAELPIDTDGNPSAYDGVARYDTVGAYWTIFQRGTGAKVRFSFDPNAPAPVRAEAPELVDLKITDHCPYGCPFCYQGSTPQGKHANMGTLSQVLLALGDLRVFEVAIGGGEPTLHPKFLEILQTARHYGVVPNFTTKNFAWLREPEFARAVFEGPGAFAYSVTTTNEVRKLGALLEAAGYPMDRASVQVVMGTIGLYDLPYILEEASRLQLRVTLLGYKNVGFGPLFKPQPYPARQEIPTGANFGGWIDIVEGFKKSHYLHVGIDTALAKEAEAELKGAGVPPQLFSTKEGDFSMYIDAVESKVGPSSYTDTLAMRRVANFHAKTIRDAFQSFAIPA